MVRCYFTKKMVNGAKIMVDSDTLTIVFYRSSLIGEKGDILLL